MVVGDERSKWCLAAVAVVPDGRSEGKESLQYPSGDSTWGSAPVTLQVELRLECGVDRLDELAEGLEQRVDLRLRSLFRTGRTRVAP